MRGLLEQGRQNLNFSTIYARHKKVLENDN